ncbi:MAG: hypothetical protein RJA70_726 [Pseudomonadota bacterium]|jgi:DNA-binding phage protein
MPSSTTDYEILAAELIRALRGKRTQLGLSRRLRSKSNVVYTWESGRRFPTAAKFHWVASRCGVDIQAAMTQFYRSEPAWMKDWDPKTAEGIAQLLNDLKGNSSVTELAKRTGFTRFSLARWLKAQAEPKLPEYLRLIEGLSLRLADWISAFVDPSLLPSLQQHWSELQAARKAAYELPWSHAVLRLLETEQYRQLRKHERGFIASRLGLSITEEEQCLAALAGAGQIELSGIYQVRQVQAIDTRQDPEAGQRLKVWWSQVALKQLEAGGAGRFSYNLFTVSERDYQRLEELHLAYFRELRAIVAQSEPAERVALVNMQLLPLENLARN